MRKKLKKRSKKQERAKHLREWRDFLKDDYDWDYDYLIRMIAFKVERMRKHMLEHAYCAPEHTKKITDQMKETVRLLTRYDEFDYQEFYEKPLVKKYGKNDFWTEESKDGRGGSYLKSKWYDGFKTAKSEKIRKEHLKALQEADDQQKRDLEAAFKIMTDNLRSWWD